MLWRPRCKKPKSQPVQFEPDRVRRLRSLRVVTAHCFAKLRGLCLDCGIRLRALVNHSTEARKYHKSPLLPVALLAMRSYCQQRRLDALSVRRGVEGVSPSQHKEAMIAKTHHNLNISNHSKSTVYGAERLLSIYSSNNLGAERPPQS